MKWICKSAQRHTNNIDIRAALEEEFHNFNVAVDRSHMQGSSIVIAYGRDMNRGEFKIGLGTYR
jgi:hypothetical protein